MISTNQFIERAHDGSQPNMKCNTFVEELLTIYYSEKKLNETLPDMILKAESPKIASGFTKHLKFTQEHLKRLETFFESIEQPIPE